MKVLKESVTDQWKAVPRRCPPPSPVSDAEQDAERQRYPSADDRADRDARDEAIRSE
jgi:hypothetical protein